MLEGFGGRIGGYHAAGNARTGIPFPIELSSAASGGNLLAPMQPKI